MAAGYHFGWPKITFECISRHFRSIRNFFFHKMAASGHFGWPKITFDCISPHFRSMRNLDFLFTKWLPAAILDDRKSLSHHFRSIRNFDFFFFTKWLPASILDGRKSPSIAFLGKFFFFTKWLPAAIFNDRKSLSITFLAISDQYATSIFILNFTKWLPATTLDDRKSLRMHFSPFQINTQLKFLLFWKSDLGHFGWPKITFDRISRHFRSIHNFFFDFFFKMAASGNFGSPICAKNNRILPLCVINGYAKYEVDRWIYDTVRAYSHQRRAFFSAAEMAARGHFVFPDWCQNHRVLVIFCDKVMACTSVGVRRRRRRWRRRNQKHNITEIFKFGDIIIYHHSH